ncbi:MAG: hypothetical protein NVS1B14_08700 [Vulcanimicrobiaceae bacterium]
MTAQAQLWLTSGVCALVFTVLGLFVRRGPPMQLDARFGAFRGDATHLAVIFTLSGRSAPLLVLGLISLGAGLAFHFPLWIPIAIFASQVCSQAVIEVAKRLFARVRPDDWLVHHELGFSYPSGHAATAVVFFGGWALASAHLIPPPLNSVVAVFLVVWMIGILWSRVALSAHYASDIAGGMVFGVGWLAALAALGIRLHATVLGR